MSEDQATISVKPFETISFYRSSPEINLTKAEIEERVLMETLHAGGLDSAIDPAVEVATAAYAEAMKYHRTLLKLWALRVNQLFHEHPQLHAFRFYIQTYDLASTGDTSEVPTIMIKSDTTLDDPPGWRRGYWNKRWSYDAMSEEERKEFDESPRGQAYGAVFSLMDRFPPWFYLKTFGPSTMVTITAEYSLGVRYDPDKDIDEENKAIRKYYALTDEMLNDSAEATDEEEEDTDTSN
jgi:hypothetical protein